VYYFITFAGTFRSKNVESAVGKHTFVRIQITKSKFSQLRGHDKKRNGCLKYCTILTDFYVCYCIIYFSFCFHSKIYLLI
jgi:hypothetical protein